MCLLCGPLDAAEPPAVREGWMLELSAGLAQIARQDDSSVFAMAGLGGGGGWWVRDDLAVLLRLTTARWGASNTATRGQETELGKQSVSRHSSVLGIYAQCWLGQRAYLMAGVGPALFLASEAVYYGVDAWEKTPPTTQLGVAASLKAALAVFQLKTGAVLTLGVEVQPTFYPNRRSLLPLMVTGGFQVP